MSSRHLHNNLLLTGTKITLAVLIILAALLFGVSRAFAFITNDPRLVGSDPNNWEQWGLQKIDAAGGWDTTQGSGDIKIAIIDSGINENHEDLQGKVVDRANFSCDPDTNDYGGELGIGHGTIIAGIAAAATNNSTGIAGMGFNTSLLNVKVTGANCQGASSSTLKQAIDWSVQAGAKVINISLSGALFYDSALDASIQNAWNSGVVIVAAAGNNDSSIRRYPAAYDNVISVGSTDKSDAKVATTNYGNWVSVAAPGQSIAGPCSHINTAYCSLNLTSASAPLVSGLAALIWARHDGEAGFDQADVKSLIETTTDIIPGTGTYWANGRINACRALGGGTSCYFLNTGDPSLVGYWKMDESSWPNDCFTLSVIDSAGGAQDGKNCPAPGGPFTTDGAYGRAGSFDGANDYIDIGSKPSLNNQTFTYSAWVKRKSTAGYQAVFAISSNSGSSGGPVFYFVPSGKLELAKAGTDVCTGNASITDTTNWHHVAVTYDGSNCRFYIDGSLDSTVAWARTFDFGTNKAFIGAHTPIYTRFNGLIDEVRVYNRVLSGSEISQLQDPATATTSGIAGYWNMNETSWVGDCSTLTVNDSSGNTNNGKACPAGGGAAATVVTGKFGNGGSFNGSSSYIDVGSHTVLNNPNFSYAAWIKRSTTTGYQGIFAISSNGGTSGGPVFYINTANKLELAKAGANVCTGNSAITDTANWHHVVISYDGSNCRFYIDGVLDAAPSWVQTFNYGTNKALIGAHLPNGTLFNGVLDEVRVYSKALSANEVSTLYNFIP